MGTGRRERGRGGEWREGGKEEDGEREGGGRRKGGKEEDEDREGRRREIGREGGGR